jgi:hypothetical protein
MKIVFWNMQRLGGDSKKREDAIKNLLLTERFAFLFLCEVTSTHPHGQINNNNPYCLRYVCYDSALSPVNLHFADPTATDEWKQASYKGGTNFKLLAPRGLAFIRVFPGTAAEFVIYVLHGPSSNNAVKVASFVACYLDDLHGDKPWVLMGDLNVIPSVLARAPVGIDLEDLIVEPDAPTHKGGKVLDYALTNMDEATVRTVRRSQRITGTDHSPISLTLPD